MASVVLNYPNMLAKQAQQRTHADYSKEGVSAYPCSMFPACSAYWLVSHIECMTDVQGGTDVGDHPPITPVRSATESDVGGGDAWRLYEYVVRHFLG